MSDPGKQERSTALLQRTLQRVGRDNRPATVLYISKNKPGDGIDGYSWAVQFVRTLSTLAPAHRERVRSTPRRTCELPASRGLSHPTLQTPLQHRRASSLLPEVRATPIPVEVALTIASAALSVGDLCFATYVLLGFVALPRTGKILPLKWVVSSGIQSNHVMSWQLSAPGRSLNLFAECEKSKINPPIPPPSSFWDTCASQMASLTSCATPDSHNASFWRRGARVTEILLTNSPQRVFIWDEAPSSIDGNRQHRRFKIFFFLKNRMVDLLQPLSPRQAIQTRRTHGMN